MKQHKATTGAIVWVDLGEGVGHEQSGRRPCVVISDSSVLHNDRKLMILMPMTTRNRGWDLHVPAAGETGLSHPSWIMTEQLGSYSVERILKYAGRVDRATISTCRYWANELMGVRLN